MKYAEEGVSYSLLIVSYEYILLPVSDLSTLYLGELELVNFPLRRTSLIDGVMDKLPFPPSAPVW